MSLSNLMNKRQKTEKTLASSTTSQHQQQPAQNPFLRACHVEETFYSFLQQVHHESRKIVQGHKLKISPQHPIFEIEGKIGMLQNPFAENARITSSGVKKGEKGNGYLCNIENELNHLPRVPFISGITKSHYIHWTSSGLSEYSPISGSLGISPPSGADAANHSASRELKSKLEELDFVEVVYNYEQNKRICFVNNKGRTEKKQRIQNIDIALPSAEYDLRISLNTEQLLEESVDQNSMPKNFNSKRVKRRRRYTRRDKSFAWQLDITEVNSTLANAPEEDITYEIEVELLPHSTYRLITCSTEEVPNLSKQLASQLWWMLTQLNPISEVLDVESFLKDHEDASVTKLAQLQCLALKNFVDKKEWNPAIPASSSSSSFKHVNFIGCMPVNFSRHDMDHIQRTANDGYYLSEKTDGVRHLLVFTSNTESVFLDRTMKGKQFVMPNSTSTECSMAPLSKLIQPGTVLDGELVTNRKYKRPIFIIFDVLCVGTRPILQQPFQERLYHLKRQSFKLPEHTTTNIYKFDFKANVLPLILKNFVTRLELDTLLSFVVEEKNKRVYKNGAEHCHCTDGIIFQPNTPYKMGTDVKLLKWKYLDTVTIDVEILPPAPHNHHKNFKNRNDDLDWRVGVLGEEGTTIDMTRYIHLPQTQRMKLEADKLETGAKIAEVGFDPETGEWYYITMRPDKTHSNHISTVLGTLLELAESLSTNELRYRMNVKNVGGVVRDMYRKEIRGMQKQMLDFQRKNNKKGH